MGRTATLDAALEPVEPSVQDVWSVEPTDARLARTLAGDRPGVGARDLLHLASCTRRKVTYLRTFDRALAAAWGG